MYFRYILAAFLTAVFVFFTFVTSIVFALNNTLFSSSFYGKNAQEGMYRFVIQYAAQELLRNQIIAKYFSKADLEREIRSTFSSEDFSAIVDDFIIQFEDFKIRRIRSVIISVKTLRENLFRIFTPLPAKILASLPVCQKDEIPFSQFPQCVVPGSNPAFLMKPLQQNLNQAVLTALPEDFQINDLKISETFTILLNLKYFLLALLIFLLGFIVLLMYQSFRSILLYMGAGFIFSGLLTYIVTFQLFSVINFIFPLSWLSDSNILELIYYLFSFFRVEMEKIAFIFTVLGLVLIILQFFFKKQRFLEQVS